MFTALSIETAPAVHWRLTPALSRFDGEKGILRGKLDQVAAGCRGGGAVLFVGPDDVAADLPAVYFIQAIDEALGEGRTVPSVGLERLLPYDF